MTSGSCLCISGVILGTTCLLVGQTPFKALLLPLYAGMALGIEGHRRLTPWQGCCTTVLLAGFSGLHCGICTAACHSPVPLRRLSLMMILLHVTL